jgi:glucose-6-phosphate 1-dehydrogenase
MVGDATLFTRSDEVEAAWQVTDPILEYWDHNPPAKLPAYQSGSWGPYEGFGLLAGDGYRWREP